MTVRLNHTIVSARDPKASAVFMTRILGLPAPRQLGPFSVVQVGDTSLDFIGSAGEITSQHYAFHVSEVEFDQIFGRIREARIRYWADPSREKEGEINAWDDGRGVYFDDPDGHLLEIITRAYGSGGTTVDKPHPLVASTIDTDER